MRLRTVTWLSAVTATVAVGMMIFAAGHVLTKPARAELGAPPNWLHGKPVTYQSESGGRIRGWFASGAPGMGGVLLLHPLRANRVAMLGRAKFLHGLGYAVMLIDLQAHGESDGERITFGWREGKDVVMAARLLKEYLPGEKIGAIGVSLGAASLVLSGAHEYLSAVVLESMYPSIEEAVEDRLRLHAGDWATVLSPLLLWQLEPRLGVSASQLRPIDQVSQIRSPILLVHGSEDRHTPIAEAKRVYDKILSAKEMYLVEGAAHVDLHGFAGGNYEGKIAKFFRVLHKEAA